MTAVKSAFDLLSDDPKEIFIYKVKSRLMINLTGYIRAKGWTQVKAAEFFGVSQSIVSNIMSGGMSKLSMETLIKMVITTDGYSSVEFTDEALGTEIKLKVGEASIEGKED